MAIGINTIGNYNPYVARTVNPSSVQPSTKLQQVVDEVKINKEAANNAMTIKEKEFFSQLYPNDKLVMDYHFYRKSGEMSGVSVGSLLDRRG